MTREEKIDLLEKEKAYMLSHGGDRQAIALDAAIKALEQEPRWTPISEGMPKVTGYYLIQYSREICADEMAVAFYDVEEKESDPDYEWEFKPNCGEYKEVIAWMPLPKAYNPQESEER